MQSYSSVAASIQAIYKKHYDRAQKTAALEVQAFLITLNAGEEPAQPEEPEQPQSEKEKYIQKLNDETAKLLEKEIGMFTKPVKAKKPTDVKSCGECGYIGRGGDVCKLSAKEIPESGKWAGVQTRCPA